MSGNHTHPLGVLSEFHFQSEEICSTVCIINSSAYGNRKSEQSPLVPTSRADIERAALEASEGMKSRTQAGTCKSMVSAPNPERDSCQMLQTLTAKKVVKDPVTALHCRYWVRDF